MDNNTAIKKLISLWSIYLVPGIIFSTYLHLHFAYPAYIIPLHLLLVTVYLLGIFCLTWTLFTFTSLKKNAHAKYLSALPFAAGFIVLISFYTINIGTNTLWGNSVPYSLILTSLPYTDSLLQALSEISLYAFISILLGFFFLVVFIFFLLSNNIYNLLLLFFIPSGRWFPFRSAHRSAFSLLALVLFSCLLVGAVSKASTVDQFQSEPILTLFKKTERWKMFSGLTPHKKRMMAIDKKARQDYPRQTSFKPKNVVILMSDSLRADHMSVYGYPRKTTPFLSRLYREGKLKKVKLALSQTSDSLGGIMATLASKNYRSLGYSNFKLHDLLKDHGYKVNFIVSGDNSNWYSLRMLYGDEIDYFYDGTRTKRFHPADDELVIEGLESLPSYGDQPNFFFLLLMSSHFLGVKKNEFEIFSPADLEGTFTDFITGSFENIKDNLINRYDNGVIQADAYIERIFNILEDKGYLQGSLIWILGDHGDGLGERGNYGHTEHLYQENLGIPLLIFDDPQIQYAGLEYGTQIDVAPSITDRLGLIIPEVWEGKSLLSSQAGISSFHQNRRLDNYWHSLVFRNNGKLYKYLMKLNTQMKIERTELYELTSDPYEENNLTGSGYGKILKQIRAELRDSYGIRH